MSIMTENPVNIIIIIGIKEEIHMHFYIPQKNAKAAPNPLPNFKLRLHASKKTIANWLIIM